MSFSLIKETIQLNEEQVLQEAIALHEEVARAMQPYVAILNSSADGKSNPFDPNDPKVNKPIPIDSFAAFLSGLKVLLDKDTRRNAYAEDFGTVQKDYDFITNVGKQVKTFGDSKNQTPQQRIIEIGKAAKNIWEDFKERIKNWTDTQIRTKFINEVKKLVADWDRQTNAVKTELNARKLETK